MRRKTAGAWVGYLWRYLGDGGGIGVTFFVGAAFVGLHRRTPTQVVAAAVAFAVFPVWAGLIATVWLAPRGQSMMFPLTPVTITLSLIGHLIFGLIMGLGFVRTRSAQRFWPWAPIVGPEALAWLPGGRTAPSAADSRPVLPPAERPLPIARPASGPVPVQAAATAYRPLPSTGERPVVVPPPPLPVGRPSGPLPAVDVLRSAAAPGPAGRRSPVGSVAPSGPSGRAPVRAAPGGGAERSGVVRVGPRGSLPGRRGEPLDGTHPCRDPACRADPRSRDLGAVAASARDDDQGSPDPPLALTVRPRARAPHRGHATMAG